ncbi:hypothetical protein PILCRDRAFT_547844 [Piloderma croceum F 1598]|uniref:Uncharacterized protein n=1 Tax=Piloderma croceum (strain F 1598) TaxID=765440 RepID=A0A0C3FJC0_PILCF|nr:hypothetical protein PILCRDRAFT_547844 [Piloderma croceum F 1598]
MFTRPTWKVALAKQYQLYTPCCFQPQRLRTETPDTQLWNILSHPVKTLFRPRRDLGRRR